MVRGIFNGDTFDQLKGKTSNMFQQCGGSGNLNMCRDQEPSYGYPSELKIHTLESTYHVSQLPARQSIVHCRQYVSDSNIFIHCDEDWYREPKATHSSVNIYPTSSNFEVVNSRYPTIDVATIETIPTSVNVPENRFKKFNSQLGINENIQTVPQSTNQTNEINRLERFKRVFIKKKIVSIETPITRTNLQLPLEERIVRMKTLFGDRPARPKIEDSPKSKQPNPIVQMFKKDASSQTDSSPRFFRLKKMLGISNGKISEDIKIDDRQIFSRQSSIPTRDEEKSKLRLPLCWHRANERIRSSVTRSRIDEVEIPEDESRKAAKFGKASSWRWRAGPEKSKTATTAPAQFTQVATTDSNILY